MLTLKLERSGSGTLQRQIFAQVRDAILTGRLAPGSELPASRLLASQYSVSRNTVLQAYEWLTSEGYLETQRGTRTFVSLESSRTLLAGRSLDQSSRFELAKRRAQDAGAIRGRTSRPF